MSITGVLICSLVAVLASALKEQTTQICVDYAYSDVQLSIIQSLEGFEAHQLVEHLIFRRCNSWISRCNAMVLGRNHQRFLYHNGSQLPLLIENSDRTSHQIVNNILKIILEDVLCFDKAVLINDWAFDNMNASAVLNRVADCKPYSCKNVSTDIPPATMVNLEVWMEAGFDKAPWVETTRLVDAGPLGPYGRMGWFVTTSVVDSFWKKNITVDHWKAFLQRSVARKFSWWSMQAWRSLCIDCEDTVYKSSKCRGSDKMLDNCATLFSSTKGLDGGVLQHQIESLGLPVVIIYLNSHLEEFVLQTAKENKPLLFFSWTPSKLTLSGNFTRISFPDDASRQHFQLGPQKKTEFQVNQFSKVVWYRVASAAPAAYHVISQMHFTQRTYYSLLEMARQQNQTDPAQLACQWVRLNKAIWNTWLPPKFTEKPKLYLAGLFPLTRCYMKQPGLVEGARLAIEHVNNDNSVLPSHELALIVNDTQCQADVAVNIFIKLMLKQNHSFKILGVLGPAQSDAAEPIAALTRHFNTLMISYGAEAAASLSDRARYPYFFRTVPQMNHFRYLYAEFFKEMGWKKVGTLVEGGQELMEYHMELQEHLQDQGITVLVKRKVLHDQQDVDLSPIFKELREQNVKIIIADLYSNVIRTVMCEAYRQKMTAHEGYVWFLPYLYMSDWWDVDFFNSQPDPSDHRTQESVPCSTEEMEYALEGHFIVAKQFIDEESLTTVGGITIKQYKEMYAERVGKAYLEETPYASFVYDAVWVFAKGLQNLLATNPAALDSLHEEKTARAFVSAINRTHFQGVSGYIRFDGSDSIGAVTIQQFFVNETKIIGSYVPLAYNQRGGLKIESDRIGWLSPHGPEDDLIRPEVQSCTVEDFRAFLGISCQSAIVVANIMGFVSFIILSIICLVFIKCRYDAKVRATQQRMKELGLLSPDYSHCLTLDEWEVVRENVVLNRKLGEGAFGTVCGGEMFSETEGWVAVAVKTLKKRHSMEEKLDLFSEVGMMKQFKHTNIVQLLGVCTRREPIYVIMEFQLHGDLKTYLLSRRSLVGQNIKEAEDVNAEKLTQMAVDIASGLQYLHHLKFVHRDLACRNCLVHANKTVKISDFGMTRHISGSDYYRFNRKGMLPVRWMSPESLVDGIFTFKSDIWSFGVVVYEIVTFGSFPYQGLSNNQVLDYVKAGNRLTLPDKCPPDLCSFIHWCMFYDQGFRPGLEDIIDYLQFNRLFLVPCMEAPITSVVMEDTDSLQMALPTPLSPPTPEIKRRSGNWQDKLASAARKTFSVSGFSSKHSSKHYSRTFLGTPSLDRLRSSSVGAMQSPTAQDSLLPTEGEEAGRSVLTRSASCLKHLPSPEASERGDSGGRVDSDYFSDNSKEMCQTITTV